MKKLTTLALPIFLSFFGLSQDLEIKSGSKGVYLVHKMAPKQGLFAVGRMYNVHPRHIAYFNGIDLNKSLAIGELINVPLTDTNFKQEVNAGVPVYYIPGSKESLANISVKYKAPINNLRGWNKISGDNVNANSKLVVGFLITNELKDKVVTITPTRVEESVSNVKKAESQKQPPVTEVKEPEQKKEEPKKVEAEPKEEKQKLVQEEPKKTELPVVKQTEPTVVKQTEPVKDDGTGYFKNTFYQQVKGSPLSKEQTVTSSIFKTMSGWQDGKYYLLINGVEPGTIVKLTNPSNSKFVFAKVLYSMDRIRENQGVDIRISDAAAASLAVNETDKFVLKVNY